MGANRRYGDRSAYPAPRPTPRRGVAHVWVRPSLKHPHMSPSPGLVVAWRRREDGWWAYVVTLSPDGTVIVTWREAAYLYPATSSVDGS